MHTLTSAYGAFSSRVKPGILAAAAYCATLDVFPIFPQSYFCVVGTILKTLAMSAQDYCEHSASRRKRRRRSGSTVRPLVEDLKYSRS